MDTQQDCLCWVRHQTVEARFGIRYGAHATNCPLYRPSLDPVDRLHDSELRQRFDNPPWQ
jgi:hypothetical protein